jgi:hypothetical protein
MIFPLLLLVLGAGAFAAYELSPKTHAWFDDHARAIQDAIVAHRAADAHLDAAAVAPHPATSAQHVQAATVANQVAAQRTAQAAQAAQTIDQQAAAAASATAIIARADKILTWIEREHTQAIQDAAVAHQAADAHLDVAVTTPNPVIVAQHAEAAATANQVAAQKTIEAAEAARTAAQRAASARSAAQVTARAAALAKLGAGECTRHFYAGVTAQKKDAIMAKLRADGKTITGNNPWNIDPNKHGVKLRAIWDPDARTLNVVVVDKNFYVPCDAIWAEIDPALREIIAA